MAKRQSKYVNHIMTEKNIVIVFDNKTVSYPRSHELFPKIKENLEKHRFDQLDLLEKVEKAFKKSSLPAGVKIKGSSVHVDGKKIPAAIEEKIIEFYNNNLPLYPIINFYRHLLKNPSKESRRDLFTFMMHNSIHLTEKGMFRVYKKVRDNFKDLHTGKMDNSVGKIVSMPREEVDPDREVTCSYGLHVASWEYAKDYGAGVLLEIQVNPKDVVSVPVDYNNSKMRVCRYKVIRVIEEQIEEALVIEEELKLYTFPVICDNKRHTATVYEKANGERYAMFKFNSEEKLVDVKDLQKQCKQQTALLTQTKKALELLNAKRK